MNLHSFKVKSILKIHAKTLPTNQLGCRLWTGCTKTSRGLCYGMIRLKYPGPNSYSRVYHVHRAIYMLEHEEYDIPRNLDVSHLCHNSLCCTIGHLSLEPREVNNDRKRCKSVIPAHCLGHDGYPNCILA